MCLHTSIDIIFIQLNGFIYRYVSLMIIFDINFLFADSEVITCIAI